MSDINKKLLKHAVFTGLVLSGILIVIQLLIYISGVCIFNPVFSILNLLVSLFINVFVMAYASVKFRNKYLERKITFLKCWTIALIVGGTSVIVTVLYNMLFHTLFGPEYYQEQIEKFREMMINWNVPEDRLDTVMADISSRFTFGKMIVSSLIMSVISTACLSLLSTVFVRKKEKVVQEVY